MSDESELSYMAGFFDGEGCMGVYWDKIKNNKKRYYPMIKLTNNNKSILKEFEDRFEGGIYKHHTSRQCWDWVIKGGKKTTYFLEIMTPYLRQKKEQAETLMEFCNTITPGNTPITPELQIYREKLSNKLKRLKKT